nr:response regulator [Bradyrhizobium elkanii]
MDDAASVRETTWNMLDDLGYRPIAADNLDTALTTLSHQAIDLAIIDLAMAGVSGLDVELELQRRQPGLLVVYCGGYPDLIEKIGKHMNGNLLLSSSVSPRNSQPSWKRCYAPKPANRLLDSDAAPNPRGLNQYRSAPSRERVRAR